MQAIENDDDDDDDDDDDVPSSKFEDKLMIMSEPSPFASRWPFFMDPIVLL